MTVRELLLRKFNSFLLQTFFRLRSWPFSFPTPPVPSPPFPVSFSLSTWGKSPASPWSSSACSMLLAVQSKTHKQLVIRLTDGHSEISNRSAIIILMHYNVDTLQYRSECKWIQTCIIQFCTLNHKSCEQLLHGYEWCVSTADCRIGKANPSHWKQVQEFLLSTVTSYRGLAMSADMKHWPNHTTANV